MNWLRFSVCNFNCLKNVGGKCLLVNFNKLIFLLLLQTTSLYLNFTLSLAISACILCSLSIWSRCLKYSRQRVLCLWRNKHRRCGINEFIQYIHVYVYILSGKISVCHCSWRSVKSLNYDRFHINFGTCGS